MFNPFALPGISIIILAGCQNRDYENGQDK